MFERADAASPVVSQAILGACVAVLDSSRGFDLVETPDRYRGWIRSAALRPLGPRSATYPRPERENSPLRAARCAALPLHIRSRRASARFSGSPCITVWATAASPIATAPLLALLEVVEGRSEWKRVRLPDGRLGWAQGGDLEPVLPQHPSSAPPPLDGAAVAATALRFLGLPYLWGGTSPFGLDCSGLAQLVYRLHGYLLPRDADLQYADRNLRAVDDAALGIGDLVFFGPDEESITHVGISLDHGEFVSATTFRTPTVRIDRLDDPYWRRLRRGARRLGRGE